MRHEWTESVVDGYATDEVDFPSRLQAAGQSVQDDVDNQIMSPLANAIDGAMLLIEGHADRVDIPGLSHAECLQREANASRSRAESALDAILVMLGDWITPAPASWSDYPQVGGHAPGLGATHLVDTSGTEDARRRNRRVVLRVMRFFPDE
jgi:flagellar motor protein MotB